jgi:phosphatidylserine decarboxylase
VLHFGEIVGERVEQVKGITYSLQALLGTEGAAVGDTTSIERGSPTPSPSSSGTSTPSGKTQRVDDEHFASINDIDYSLGSLLGTQNAAMVRDPSAKHDPSGAYSDEHDASHPPENAGLGHDLNVALRLGSEAATHATDPHSEFRLLHPERNNLYFCVIYLAPGDYHRFHSPVAWVVERRRHFTGDLFSVSPYIVNRLKDLFVLNERVALLGRWKHGFYSMVPVGATNVGSIRINFDESLRTNTRQLTHPAHTFTEAVYTNASSTLGGQPLLAGEEMGGFRLGSTIVLVFEAPKDWKFGVKAGEKIKVGEALGEFNSEKKGQQSQVVSAL